jgi:hypothetical protein
MQVIWAFLSDTLADLANNTKPRAQVDAGFSIWIKWIALQDFVAPPEPEYWDYLLAGLVTGYSERRKQCLYIVRKSLARGSIPYLTAASKPADSKSLEDSWVKYCILFEMMTIDKSVNQVVDALPELRNLLKPESGLPGNWLTALIGAGMTPPIPDNIRKVIGNFILDVEKPDFLIEGSGFVTEALFPWALSGGLFTASMQGSTHCTHGDRLRGFLSRLIASSPTELKDKHAQSTLKFLQERRDLSGPFRVYTLLGIRDGLKGTSCLTDWRRIAAISSSKRYQPLVNDLISSICIDIFRHFDVDQDDSPEMLHAISKLLMDHKGSSPEAETWMFVKKLTAKREDQLHAKLSSILPTVEPNEFTSLFDDTAEAVKYIIEKLEVICKQEVRLGLNQAEK